jgi:hypothetical protein
MVMHMPNCSVCGVNPGTKRIRVSEKFVSYPDLFAGGMVCELCSKLFEDKRFRMSSWILVNNEFRFLDRKEVLSVLKSLPENSLVYIRSSGRKYGFLKCMRFRSTKTVAVVCGEDEGPIVVPRERLAKVLDTAVAAYRVLKRKTALLEGCSASDWVHEDVCRAVEELRGDPLWQTVVRVL